MFRFFVASILLSFSVFSFAASLDPFRLENAPISELANWVSAASGQNIILGKGVEGNLSLQVRDLEPKDLIPFFCAVMEASGYVCNKNSVGYIVSKSDASDKQQPSDVIHDQLKTEIIPFQSRLYTLTHARNIRLVEAINAILNTSSASQKSVVVALPNSNSLLVSATNEDLHDLDNLISSLDTKQQQIMIQAVIIESEVGRGKEIGVNLSTSVPRNGFSVVSNTIAAVADSSALGMGGHLVFSGDGDIRGLVSAMLKDSKSKILSTPNMVVLDREQGAITVGQNVPFVISREVTDGGKTIQQIQRQDVGITLSVVPHVVQSSEIVLQIRQESSSVSNSSQASDIITNKRSISTVASLHDGDTVVLGGLVSDESQSVKNGVPILRDLPLFGSLFGSTANQSVQRELTVLLKAVLL